MRAQTIVAAALGLVFGAALGTTAGYLVSERRFVLKKEEEYQEKKRKEKEAKKAAEPAEEEKEETKEPDPKPTEVEVKEYRDKSSIYMGSSNVPPVNYTGYSEPESNVAPVEHSDEPYLIDEYKYDNDGIGKYTKRHITWYAKSHDLIDDDDTGESLYPKETVGVENLLHVLKKGTIYVRNEALDEDYEVKLMDDYYEPMV